MLNNSPGSCPLKEKKECILISCVVQIKKEIQVKTYVMSVLEQHVLMREDVSCMYTSLEATPLLDKHFLSLSSPPASTENQKPGMVFKG